MKLHHFKIAFLLILMPGLSFEMLAQNGITSNFSATDQPPFGSGEDCEEPTNVAVNYEAGMATAEVSWDGELPQEGWILLYGHEGGIDLGGFLSDPESWEDPESDMERVYASPHTIYANMLQEGPKEIYVVADCGNGVLMVSESAIFEIGEPAEEIVEGGDCETPFNVNGAPSEPGTMDLSWEPQDGGLYHIAWGPNGHEMNEEFFHINEAGSVIVSDNPYHLIFPNEDDYSVFIRKFCGENVFSEWTVPTCVTPSDPQSEVTESEVTLTWTAPAGQNAWQVSYGHEGYNPDEEGNMDYAYNTPIHTLSIGDLDQGLTYDFYIRTDCGTENFSPWSEVGSFATEFMPCDPVSETAVSHITNQSADISWTPTSNETQWEVVYGIAPLDESEATTLTLGDPEAILLDLEPNSTYELYVVSLCASGESAQGETISFSTLDSDGLYCLPYIPTGCMHSSEINHVKIDGENETQIHDLNSGCSDSNYENKTDLSVDLAPGNGYFARVASSNFGVNGNQLAMWIDFDDDGVFDETERVGEGSMISLGSTDVAFSIPAEANPGEHRMRIMLAFNSYPHNLSPCNAGESISANGEVHDYTVNILALETCEGASGGEPISDFEICPGEALTLSTLNSSGPADGLTRTWQHSPVDENDWTDLTNGTLPTTTLYNGIQEATDYRYVVTCAESGETSISETLRVTLSTDCHCIPEAACIGGSLGGRQINLVSLMGETVGLDNASGGCVDNGYSDYSINFPPDLKQGYTYTLSVTLGNATLNSDRVKAWIDFNGNKIFEENDVEIIMNFEDGFPEPTVTADFTVPLLAEPGLYKMRVRLGANFFEAPPITGCSTLGFGGESEDYLIEVIEGDLIPCLPPSDVVAVPEDGSNAAVVNWIPGGDESQWELVYGLPGFDPDLVDETIAVYDVPNHLITDLEPETVYTVYVRSVCENGMSAWSDSTSFSTGGVSVDDAVSGGVKHYPNPATDKLYLEAPVAVQSVEILTITGKHITTVHPSGTFVKLDVFGLAKGVYFAKVRMADRFGVIKFIRE